MKTAVVAELQPMQFQNIRQGDVRSWLLLEGRRGDPGTFELRYNEIAAGYETPRHRHNFEQVRWVLEGKFTLAKDKFIQAGEVGYWPEGVYYGGPAEGELKAITLQCGGPSGYGVLSLEQVAEGRAALSRSGSFHDGVYTVVDAQGRKRNRDSYEAIWEYLNNRPIEYPNPRYREVAVIDPQAHLARQSAPGIRLRHLGTFSEGYTALILIEADAGATLELGHARQASVAFLRSGELADRGRRYPARSAFHLEAGEKARLAVEQAAQVLQIRLPQLGGLVI